MDNESQRDATADHLESVSGWRPAPSWLFVAIDLESVTVIEWVQGAMALTRWLPDSGLMPIERRALDRAGGRYGITSD